MLDIKVIREQAEEVKARLKARGGEHWKLIDEVLACDEARRAAEAGYARGVETACAALAQDFRPLDDQRASAWYRLSAAQGLLRKFHAGIGPRALLEVTP